MRCPHCRAAQLIVIRVELAASHVTMHSCLACESRWWDIDGRLVALDQVLSTVAAA